MDSSNKAYSQVQLCYTTRSCFSTQQDALLLASASMSSWRGCITLQKTPPEYCRCLPRSLVPHCHVSKFANLVQVLNRQLQVQKGDAFGIFCVQDLPFWRGRLGVHRVPSVVFLRGPGALPAVYDASNTKRLDIAKLVADNSWQVLTFWCCLVHLTQYLTSWGQHPAKSAERPCTVKCTMQ